MTRLSVSARQWTALVALIALAVSSAGCGTRQPRHAASRNDEAQPDAAVDEAAAVPIDPRSPR